MATACNEYEQDLVLYHYGDLHGTDRDQIATHVHGCAACASYLKELATLLPLTVKLDEPAEDFWHDYSREMRHKLAVFQEKKRWWQTVQESIRPWTIPALAATAVVALTLTLTSGKKHSTPTRMPTEDQVLMEVLPMAENLELFNNMEVLESIDLLELIGSLDSDAA
ncbi:MAG: hypothetical protein GEU77_15920 [Deltaproteobacteria bacterium]|nr:hypothetical protein [Deltaproteobacteria bacterium]